MRQLSNMLGVVLDLLNLRIFLPRCCLCKTLLYEKQTNIPDSLRLLLAGMLYGGKIFKNEEEVVPFFSKSVKSWLQEMDGTIAQYSGTG